MVDSSWSRGWRIFRHSFSVFREYPVFIVPIFIVWIIYASGILYLKYFYLWGSHSYQENLWVVFSVIFIFSFTILMSCSLVLELIQHIEKGKSYFFKACWEAVTKNMLKIIPLALVWAVIWFALTLLDAVLSKKEDDDNDEFNAQNAAETIAGYRQFSLSSAFIDGLQKGIRMVMFLILPAIAWEDLSFIDATKKGLVVLKARVREFATGYALTYAAAIIIFIPPCIIFELGKSKHGHPPLVHFPDYVWVGTIIYIGIAWSFFIYFEQLFMAQLYLWHIEWQKKAEEAKKNNLPVPDFNMVERPILLAKTPFLFR